MRRFFIIVGISVLSLFSVSAQTELRTILSQINADSLKKTVDDLVNFNNRFCSYLPENNKKVSQYIVQRLHNYGVANAAIDSFYLNINHFLGGKINQYMYNVKSRLQGNVKPDSIIIIGAHLDAISYDVNYILQNHVPGANDNATGIAVMIEVARIFHANNLVPKYSVDFMAYDAEELGLFGSIYDANTRKSAQEKIYVMLNNDMVGLQDENAKTWKVVFHADAENVENKAKNSCHDYTRLQPYIPDNLDSSYRNSDSWAYRMAGFKTFYTHEYDDDPHYHTILDLPQRLNYNYMAEIAKLHFTLIYDFVIENIISETGINEPFLTSASFLLYPNPTSGQLRIKNYELRENTVLEIYDIVGKKVMLHNIPLTPFKGGMSSASANSPFEGGRGMSEIEIDVSHLVNGIYFLKIQTDKGIVIKKIVKN